ncbi:MAG: hypothetical protein SXV54_01785 [Chloroflexota bacterium]|nr:hypothetical protein [Chloroflexota bacterium]
MKTALRIGLGIAVAAALVIIGLSIGWSLWGRSLWAAGPFTVPGTGTRVGRQEGCGGWGGWQGGMGPGMMGRVITPEAPCAEWDYGIGFGAADAPSSTLTIDYAHKTVEQYVASLGYANLEVAEVMEFERNFYAIVQDSGTGIGAMELLIDRWTGAVGPEMGPNMMWNGRYGMHGRGMGMKGRSSESNALSPEEALESAQRWLNTYRSGVTVEEHADPFYGYYTIHTLENGEIEGMLSVHGTTGQVWYHTWHGKFIQMIDLDKDH